MQDKTDKPRKPVKRGGIAKKLMRLPGNRRGKAQLESQKKKPAGFDPELLYVECARCGAPVLWEPGRATSLLAAAGVDPLELDATCLLLTDACPSCGGSADEYSVRIVRVSDRPPSSLPPGHGNA